MPLENMLKNSLGSWIKPLGFDLCQCGPWDSFANEILLKDALDSENKQQDLQVEQQNPQQIEPSTETKITRG
jgi:hypothetical protein